MTEWTDSWEWKNCRLNYWLIYNKLSDRLQFLEASRNIHVDRFWRGHITGWFGIQLFLQFDAEGDLGTVLLQRMCWRGDRSGCACISSGIVLYCIVLYCIVLYCIVLYCCRVPAANAPGCTAAEGILYKPWSLVVHTCTARCLHQRP